MGFGDSERNEFVSWRGVRKGKMGEREGLLTHQDISDNFFFQWFGTEAENS